MAMNEMDVAGLLQTYALRAKEARSTEQLREIVRELKTELDLRKLRVDNG